METRYHAKNGAIPKSLMSRKHYTINNMKKTTILTFSSIVVLLFLISSCQQSRNSNLDNSVSYSVSPDSLINIWNEAWNKHDSTAISNMLATNSVVVFSTEEKLVGVNTIMTDWVSKNLPMVTNLKTEKTSAATSSEMAYFNGTYTLDIVRNDTILGSDKGCFTFVWKLQDSKDWKMELIFFGKNAE